MHTYAQVFRTNGGGAVAIADRQQMQAQAIREANNRSFPDRTANKIDTSELREPKIPPATQIPARHGPRRVADDEADESIRAEMGVRGARGISSCKKREMTRGELSSKESGVH